MDSGIMIRPEAESDLIRIWVYIARDNRSAADRVLQAVENTFESIVSMPGMGANYRSKRPDLIGIRFFPVHRFPNYIIYYRDADGVLEIIRVLHSQMKISRHLEL